MSILYELRYPRRWSTKLFVTILVLVLSAVLATVAIAGFLVYRIVKPQRTSSEISMESFPGRPDAVEFSVPGIGARHGWFFPGLRGAPTIVLCHGYGSSRGELLTLVSALQDHQYAALREAEYDHRVRAIILDSVYDLPEQMVKIGVERTGLGGFPLMARSAEFSFNWLNYKYRANPPLSQKLSALAGVPKLFIEAADDPELGAITRQMFQSAPEPKDQAVIPHGNYVGLNDADKREYENRVVSYFLLKMPATGKAGR